MLDGSGTRKLITASGNNTFILKATMATLSEAISPTIDVSRLGILAVHNKINNLGLANSDVTVVNVGSGYANTNDVTVTISGGGGSGAQAVANVVANTIDAVYITNAGSGYTGTPTITITPGSGGGSGANVIITGETSSAGGPALARYITRRVTLSEGFDSGDLRVYMTAYKPAGSDIHVYAKLLSASDPGLFEEKPWVLLTQIDNTNFVSTSVGDYREITYAPGIGGVANNSVSYTSGSSTFDTFKTFAIKIVFTGTNSYDVPKVRDFRVIALPAG
jgi:hypothetical protein